MLRQQSSIDIISLLKVQENAYDTFELFAALLAQR